MLLEFSRPEMPMAQGFAKKRLDFSSFLSYLCISNENFIYHIFYPERDFFRRQQLLLLLLLSCSGVKVF